jgi:hypothetical protein
MRINEITKRTSLVREEEREHEGICVHNDRENQMAILECSLCKWRKND